jgi:hypothetical protein
VLSLIANSVGLLISPCPWLRHRLLESGAIEIMSFKVFLHCGFRKRHQNVSAPARIFQAAPSDTPGRSHDKSRREAGALITYFQAAVNS